MIVGVYALPLRNRFRGIDVRHGLLLRGPAGWAEFSPFEEYTRPETDAWRAAALEAAELGFPAPVRDMVPVNVTVPAVDAATAHRIVTGSGCTTAKVKVAEPGQPAAADLARVEAVRDALGPSGAIRVDANGAWSPEEALGRLRELARFGLELAERLGLPVVVSSALESSVGLRAGVALAAALPELPYACGLNTATMFTTDVTTEPLVAVDGAIAVRPVTVDGAGWQADAAVAARWVHRWEHGGMPERP
jgi:O-succinylbenzoate synthase